MADKALQSTSTYDVIELIGTSSTSWEDAAKNVIDEAAKQSPRAARSRGGREGPSYPQR
jgi:Dodecin